MFYFAKVTFESDKRSKVGPFAQESFLSNVTFEINFPVRKGPYTLQSSGIHYIRATVFVITEASHLHSMNQQIKPCEYTNGSKGSCMVVCVLWHKKSFIVLYCMH